MRTADSYSDITSYIVDDDNYVNNNNDDNDDSDNGDTGNNDNINGNSHACQLMMITMVIGIGLIM